ncbi:methyltransferase-like protein 7B [Dinothrombium tinctorium]|uniref:Methyltransferase-like protein 7B n=1 Tax=Dinothrombium tinctorium TaxID=1965070 RepID=A0A3S3Q645_9ACAR|nr:methyltransferase-like protein 7B [Dinothrombium tinctorium]RWS17297.1 methyltransferase-like protein 7B [Dinothrombium tinctorium]RWS17304.1 methyltransferase-like protein 7B [Dinothrombium tinctorium]
MLLSLLRPFFAAFHSWLEPKLFLFFGPAKDELLKPLKNLDSPHNTLQVLEIGIGNGANFQYYPPNFRITALDVNDHFEKYLKENVKKYEITLEKLVFCKAEDMKEIADDSMDIVVSTLLLCCVEDPYRVIKEIKRVLKSDGKWIFLEHGRFRGKMFHNLIQWLLNPLTYIIGAGCRLTRKIDFMIESVHFSSVDIKYREIAKYGFTLPIFPHYYGIAVK